MPDTDVYQQLEGKVYMTTENTAGYIGSISNSFTVKKGFIFIGEKFVDAVRVDIVIYSPEELGEDVQKAIEDTDSRVYIYQYVDKEDPNKSNPKELNIEEIKDNEFIDIDKIYKNENGYNFKIDSNGEIFFCKNEANYVDDFFTTNYISADESQSDYTTNLNGLQVKDIRNILGAPHQFLPETDARIDSTKYKPGDNVSLGRVYTAKILKYAPILFITPGVPSFMSGFSDEQKTTVIEQLFKVGGGDSGDLNTLLNNYTGRYYTLKFAYTSYYYYVNFMLRNASIFLGIDQETLDGDKLCEYNWLKVSNTSAGEALKEGSEGNIIEGAFKLIGKNNSGCLAFYADCGTSADEQFSNSTTQSQLASTINGFSDQGRELNFLIGNVGSITGLELDKMMTSETLFENRENLTDFIDKLLGKNNIFSSILNKVQTVLAGGHMDFPELWSDSSFSRSYSCKMKLVSPTGDKLSIFLNILVPIYHILALTLPRQSDGQSYFSPFLVRAYYKGMFNVNMGLISDLSISKGDQGEWSADGIPTVAEISFSIRDLYDTMFMSKFTDNVNIMSNIAELDYIANSCGININDQDIGRLAKMYASNIIGTFSDKVEIGIFGSLSQWVNQKLNNIFGVF